MGLQGCSSPHTVANIGLDPSSTFGALEEEKGWVVNTLLKNGYPKRFIHQIASTPTPVYHDQGETKGYSLPSIRQGGLRAPEEVHGRTPD